MKFGLMTQIQIPRPWQPTSEREAYWNALEQAVAAEQVGFEYAWMTEQHFLAEIGHAAASDLFMAALSQRTTTMRLGLGVILLPLHNPFIVAERVATLDVLSRGGWSSAPAAAPAPTSSKASASTRPRAATWARKAWKPS